jgi:hypothetical protein
MNFIERFWSHVDVREQDECWEWTAGRNREGYGKVKIGGKNLRSHRVMYELEIDDIPKGMIVMHLCDNPACCNPRHLVLGTDRDNVEDKIRKGRERYASGEDHGNSKTSEVDVIAMKKLYKSGFSIKYISDKFNMSHVQVGRIVHGTAWKQVE